LNNIFCGCSNLTSIDLSNFVFNNPISSVKSIFNSCRNLKYIDISNFEFSSNYSSYNIFDNSLPSNGTLIVKDEKVGNIVKDQLKNWEIKYKNKK